MTPPKKKADHTFARMAGLKSSKVNFSITDDFSTTEFEATNRNDEPLAFSTCAAATTNAVKNGFLSWNQFVARLRTPAVSNETRAEYSALPRDDQAKLKDVGGYLPQHFDGERRERANAGSRQVLALDADHADDNFLAFVSLALCGFAFVIHSTRKHSAESPRYRLLVPLTRAVTEVEYLAIARRVAADVDIEEFDDTSFQFTRLMYWPSVCSDAEYVFRESRGEWLNPDTVLATYADFRDVASWPVSTQQSGKLRESKDKAGNPCEKPGVIGAFCRAYDVHAAIDKFLPGVYTNGAHSDRLTFAGGSSSNGAVVYDDGTFLFSHHESDPCSGELVNAFDLVRIHKFGHLDSDARAMPINERPSHKAMRRLAEQDGDVRAESIREVAGDEFDDFDDDAETAKRENWLALPPDVAKEIQAAKPDALFLPNDYVTAPVAAERIFSQLGSSRELYRRGNAVVELDQQGHVSIITPTALRSRLNNRGRKVRAFKSDAHGKLFHAPKQCSDDVAKLLLSTLEIDRLPAIELVVRMPVLIEHGGELVSTRAGYNAECGVLVTDKINIPALDVQTATKALRDLLHDFQFAESGDEARMLASLIAPALRMGRLVRGDALVTAVEADQSQSGKGYALQLIRALYGEQPYIVAQRSGGVGSVDESLAQALLSGAPFVSLDNIRGRLDSTFLESALTAGNDPVAVRVPHRGEVRIDIRRTLFQLTSNGIESTTDLANRLLLIRLRKQPSGYKFTRYIEGDLLQHVEAHRGRYLGAVHAIIRHWFDAGRPQHNAEHSFRAWVGVLDWIAREVFGAVPLLTGHRTAIDRIADPGLSWLRLVATAVIQAGRVGDDLRALDIFVLARDHGTPPPQTRPECDEMVGARAVGRVLGRIFAERESLELDGVQVTRTEFTEWDARHRSSEDRKCYVFSRINDAIGL